MKVELIPVLEVTYFDQEIETPKCGGPYWQHPHEWEFYKIKCLQKAGFKDEFIPFEKASNFYRAIDISEDNLLKIVNDHLDTVENDNWDENDVIPLVGGYVLRINDENKLFPQCCSDLSIIENWESIIKKEEKGQFYIGHPTPKVEIKDNVINFICDLGDERFTPPVDDIIRVNFSDLTLAYKKALEELKILEEKLKNIENKLKYKPKEAALTNILIYQKSELDN